MYKKYKFTDKEETLFARDLPQPLRGDSAAHFPSSSHSLASGILQKEDSYFQSHRVCANNGLRNLLLHTCSSINIRESSAMVLQFLNAFRSGQTSNEIYGSEKYIFCLFVIPVTL